MNNFSSAAHYFSSLIRTGRLIYFPSSHRSRIYLLGVQSSQKMSLSLEYLEIQNPESNTKYDHQITASAHVASISKKWALRLIKML